MRSPQRVVWSEGMLLSPQHLQSLDRAYESLVAARVGALAPVDWGVLELEIDEAALAAGEVRVLRFAGVFPDGLPLAFEDAERAPAPRPAEEKLAPAARSLDVYLAVPREREGVASFADEGAPSASRYAAAARMVQDATAPGATAEVRFARPNATLLLGDEPREDHETIKLAEVVRAPSGQLALEKTYVPPCLRVAVSPWVLGSLRELLALLITKHRGLAETQRHRESASEMAALDVRRLLQLLVLGTHIPELAHLADAGDTSPRECYRALGQLAGQLCTFRGDDPSAIPKFKHVDLRATFEPLFAQLKELVGPFGAAAYLKVPLEQRPGGVYLARLGDERILRAPLFLTISSEQPEGRVAEQVPELCKVSSSSEIVTLIRGAVRGLELQVVHRPPPQLPVKAGVVYFALVQQGRYWDRIVAERNLSLFLPPPFDPARTHLELLAVSGVP
jgi:type VI secretion system protein ImpJ